MIKSKFLQCIFLSVFGIVLAFSQIKTSILLQSTDEDERIEISINKSIYFPGDTVLLVIQRNDNTATAGIITPILLVEGTTFKTIGRLKYLTVIPTNVTPGSYPIRLNVKDSDGRRFRYDTDCRVIVEEYQDVEKLNRYIDIVPISGSGNIRKAVTLEREQIRNLRVQFQRDSIRPDMGPQFLRITTSILLREGIAVPSYERRVVTYRNLENPDKDRAMFIQYRTAYGTYANIRPEELTEVLVPVDSLPDWAILGVHIEPDYSIKIGAVDRSNRMSQYFRVRGPTVEIGFSLAVPKVIYDTRADDPIEYGNTSAMIRLYFIDSRTGNRFPISAGFGMFGVNSPVDVGIGRGGFAWSMFLDLAEMVRITNIGFTKQINIGLELAPFIPIQRKIRLLVVAQAGFSF